jgi:hypothetical protein
MGLTRDPWDVARGAAISIIWAALASRVEEVGQEWGAVNEAVDFRCLRFSFPLRAEVHACDRVLPLSERAHRPASSSKLPGRRSLVGTVVGEGTGGAADRPSFASKVRLS